MIDRLIAEATECDFKVAVEVKKPKSWLKSVSAFANGAGGSLFFGIDDGKNIIGLTDPQADGIREVYIRLGNESVVAPDHVLNQLLLKGMNLSFDALISSYDFQDYSFSKLREQYKAWTGNSMDEKLFDSFEIRDKAGKLTNAGALLADNSPIRHSRLFCTRWGGLDKSGGLIDALDSAEYSGSLIIPHRDISTVSSTRRNPVLADIFGRLGYMERQGSGLNKIRDAYESSANFRAGMEPFFYSDGTQFTVTLPNLNYHANTHQVAIDVAIDKLKVTDSTKAKIRLVFSHIGYDVAFGRKEVAEIIGISQTAAGNLINKLKVSGMVEPVSGLGKGKYKFKK